MFICILYSFFFSSPQIWYLSLSLSLHSHPLTLFSLYIIKHAFLIQNIHTYSSSNILPIQISPSKHKIPRQSQHKILHLHKPIVKTQPTKKNSHLNHTIAINTTTATATTGALMNSISLQSHSKYQARKWLGQLRSVIIIIIIIIIIVVVVFGICFGLDLIWIFDIWEFCRFAGIDDKICGFCFGVALSLWLGFVSLI